MNRNLIICCDGTNNQFGRENTNVVRLVQVLDRAPAARQLLYYDPGVGTLPEPTVLSRIRKNVLRWLDLAFATGLTRNVEEAYSYLMEFWEPGDNVYLFGFSRGAYTVRVLAGLLHTLGLLPRGGGNLVPYALRLFAGARKSGAEVGGMIHYRRLVDEFRATFSRPVSEDNDDRRFPVHFLGVWDTVSSVGWVWEPAAYPYTRWNPSIRMVRHAVALDERRAFFRQNLIDAAQGQDHLELWFPGVHADVGGGYPEKDGGLWRAPFRWMVDEAQKAGMRIDQARRDWVMTRTPGSATPWNDRQHESLTCAWWPVEFFPKLHWKRSTKTRWPRANGGRHRSVPRGALLDETVLRRIRETGYSPPNLSKRFLQAVRDLPTISGAIPYQK